MNFYIAQEETYLSIRIHVQVFGRREGGGGVGVNKTSLGEGGGSQGRFENKI